MAQPSAAQFRASADMDELYRLLDAAGMGNGWAKREPSLYPSPKKTFVPAHWRFELAKAALEAAGRFVSTELAERRNLILFNPIPGNTYATARTLVAAYQMVLGGETARSHRHSPNALRLVMDTAPGAYTVVNGKKLPMQPGDVLLTPNWSWHGHSNESPEPAFWIDFLDVPLVEFLAPMFFEQHPGGLEPAAAVDSASPMRFPFAQVCARLDSLPDSHGVRELELGPPSLDTVALRVSRLEPGRGFSARRTTANCLFAVMQGRGHSNVDGTEFDWSRGDVFVVPSWRTHECRATERSHLFKVTDEPFIRRLNWLREE